MKGSNGVVRRMVKKKVQFRQEVVKRDKESSDEAEKTRKTSL